jgi:AsmA protein
MKRIIKRLFVVGGVFLVLVVAAGLIVPKFIDVKKYKPVIEQKVAEATGRSFSLGDEIDVSIFPWVGVKLNDLHLGNPVGHTEKDMVSVKSFEVRLKVMPLLSKKIEVKTFVLDSPRIYLGKLKNGTANWQGLGKKHDRETKAPKPSSGPSSEKGLPISGLMVGNFSITGGRLTYVDEQANLKKEITDLDLNLGNISLENPVTVSFKAKIDGKPVSLDGSAGPLGLEPGKGSIALNFVLKALNVLEVNLKGNLIDLLAAQNFDLEVDVPSFSPKKLFAALDQNFPVQTRDPKVLDAFSFKTRLKGSPGNISLSMGEVLMDDSRLSFSGAAKAFAKPDLKFDLQLDAIDLDRYLPESREKEKKAPADVSASGKDKAIATERKRTDYGPLRRLVLDGNIKAAKVKAGNAVVENIDIRIRAANGIVTLDPLNLGLYRGSVASRLELNVQASDPVTKIRFDAQGIQAGALMKDAVKKELIEGTLTAGADISMAGETPDMIKQTLTGQGELLFADGAIIGIDLAGMVRNVKTSFGMEEKSTQKPKTDFAELKIPFTAKSGLVNMDGTRLSSPLLRVLVNGTTDLVREELDLRVEPKFVATLKGQGDTQERSGITVPVLITGSFSAPKIRPDLKGMIKGGLPDAQNLKQVLGTKADQKEKIESVKKDVEKTIKGLLPGFTD